MFYDKYAKTKRRLFLLVLVLTFMTSGAGLGILKLSNLKTVGRGLETVYHNGVKPLKELKMLSDMYGVTIVDTANKVSNNTMSWTEGRNRLEKTIKRITELREEYLKTYLIVEEKRSVEELLPLFHTADSALVRLKKILENEDRNGLSEFINKDLYQTIEPVTGKIDELFQMQVRIVKDINDTEKVRYKLGQRIGTASIVLSIGLFFLAVIQWRRFRSLLDFL